MIHLADDSIDSTTVIVTVDIKIYAQFWPYLKLLLIFIVTAMYFTFFLFSLISYLLKKKLSEIHLSRKHVTAVFSALNYLTDNLLQ